MEGRPSYQNSVVDISHGAAGAELEREQHFRECTALGTENHTKPQIDDADSFLAGRFARPFPFPADIGQKIIAGGAGFCEQFVAPIAIDSDGRGTHQRLGWFNEMR